MFKVLVMFKSSIKSIIKLNKFNFHFFKQFSFMYLTLLEKFQVTLNLVLCIKFTEKVDQF